jgi:hypothetical protein
MNVPFAIAGALALVAAFIHGAAGEALVVTKLRTEVLSPTPFGGASFTKLMIRVTWHITTIAFAVIGSAMAVCAPGGSGEACRGVGRVASISFTGFAALTFGLAVMSQGPRSLLRTVRRHPAPVIFVLVAALAWWGQTSY